MKSSQKEKTEYEQNYFFDTSALIKLYHYEEGTESVEQTQQTQVTQQTQRTQQTQQLALSHELNG